MVDSAPLFNVKNLMITIGNRCLVEGFSWQVRAGERWAIVGANGCGKSSLMAAVAGLPLAGRSVQYERLQYDRDLIGTHSSQVLAQYRSVCPQRLDWNTALTPLQLAQLMAVSQPSLHAFANGYKVPLSWLSMPLNARSGGEQQLLALALVSAAHKSVLFADEPLTHLDEVVQHHVLSVLGVLGVQDVSGRAADCATVIVSHHLRLSIAWATHLLMPANAQGQWVAAEKVALNTVSAIAAAYQISTIQAQALLDGHLKSF